MYTDDKTMTRINLLTLFIAIINNISVQSTYLMFVCFRLLSQGSVCFENTGSLKHSGDQNSGLCHVMSYFYSSLFIYLFVFNQAVI